MKVNRIVRARELAGLSLAQAAKLLGLKLSTLSEVEDGQIKPSYGWLRDMANLYRCSVAWLCGETAPLSSENEALLHDVEHTGDRATLREFMEMVSTLDPGTTPQTARERLNVISRQRGPLGTCDRTDLQMVGEAIGHPAGGTASQPVSRKRRYVRSQGQTRKHHCHWPGCTAQVPPAMWGCKAHWFRLPKALRDRIWATYAPGQEADMSPSDEYLQAADDVQRWIREHGAKP